VAQKRHPKGASIGGQFAESADPEATVELTPAGLTTDDPRLRALYASAARLQELVPDAVLVGGSAAIFYASHRRSTDHDHVLVDLRERFDVVLEALESQGGWITNRVVFNKIILGSLGGIKAGVRQLRRTRPLEVAEYTLPDGGTLRVPTPDETLRIKAYLIVTRNYDRDFTDVAALSAWMGRERAAETLVAIGDYYDDDLPDRVAMATQIAYQLAHPEPLPATKPGQGVALADIGPQWRDFDKVREECAALAVEMVLRAGPEA
jgi:hypothetical protein